MIERIGYLISSHTAYQAPLQRLLMAMPSTIATRDIVAVVGGCAERARRQIIVRQIEVEHTSYDYTALIDLVEHPESYPAWSHIFLLHDTMELGPRADQLIRAADPEKDATAAWGGECNLALYRADYLHRRRDELRSLKDCTKFRAVQVEGFLWRTLSDERRGIYAGDITIGEPEKVYGGTARQRVYYAGVDVVKWKANWGQTWPPNVVTP
jgi:hypothetical protein